MDKILSTIGSPRDLQGLSQQELTQLAAEIREALCGLASRRTAHFASNLGVVELTLALHTTFDFSRDRLIWDTVTRSIRTSWLPAATRTFIPSASAAA